MSTKEEMRALLIKELNEIKKNMTHQTAFSKQIRYIELSMTLFGLTEPEAMQDLVVTKRLNRNAKIREKGWRVNVVAKAPEEAK